MATLNIGGKRVKVSDEFLSLSPEQQQATVDEIAGSLGLSAPADQPPSGSQGMAPDIGASIPDVPVNRQPSWGETGMDMAKGFGTGVVQGAIGLASMPQDIGNWLGAQAGYGLSRLTGETPEQAQATVDQMGSARGALSPPSSQDMTSAWEGTFGPMYQPQTTAGEYGNTIGQFVAGAAAGPGSLARKAALAVVPGMASETAGQATEGTAAEPYARIVAGLLGGLAASTRGNIGTKQMLKEAPTREAVAVNKTAAYDAIDNAGIVFDKNAYKSAAMRIKYELADKGWDKLQGGQVAPLVNRIDGMLKPRAVPDWTKVDGILKDAKKILRSAADETTKMNVGIVVNKLEDLVKNGKIASKKGNMPRAQLNETIDRARELARRNIIARDIEKMKNKAEWYRSGPESGLRNQFGSYGSKYEGGLGDAEKAAFKAVVNREGALNLAHTLGSRMGNTVMGGVGLYTGQIVPALVGIVGSAAARKFMEVYTMKGVDAALKTVLAGKSAQQKAAVMNAIGRGQGRVQSLLAAQGSTVPLLGQ